MLHNTLKNRPVGNIFRYELFKLRVVTRGHTCSGCFFENDDCSGYFCTRITGNCIAADRNDNTNVKFEVYSA